MVPVEEDAVTLLLTQSATLDGMSDHDNDLTGKLASELGGIPLALESECDITTYIQLQTKHTE
jgi:hypothetical protein